MVLQHCSGENNVLPHFVKLLVFVCVDRFDVRCDGLHEWHERVESGRKLDRNGETHFRSSKSALRIDEREPRVVLFEGGGLDVLPQEAGEVEKDGADHCVLAKQEDAALVHHAHDEERVLEQEVRVGEIEAELAVEDGVVCFGLDAREVVVCSVAEFDDDVRVARGVRCWELTEATSFMDGDLDGGHNKKKIFFFLMSSFLFYIFLTSVIRRRERESENNKIKIAEHLKRLEGENNNKKK